MSDVYPDDSVSQTGNIEERNQRYSRDLSGDEAHISQPRSDARMPSQEEEAHIAERVRTNVREYLQIEDKMRRLLAATRSVRKQKKELQNKILGDMRSLDVENLDLKKGKLVAKRSTPKVPLTKASITSVLSKNFTDQEFITRITTLLYEERDRAEKVSLTHYVKRGDK
jgi:hypothetical protein